MIVEEAREQFARDRGFDSYFALVESSGPLPANDGANWFVSRQNLFLSVDGAGRWFAWDEATLGEVRDETVLWRDSCQPALANAAPSESEENCMMALLAPLPKWQECDAVH